MLSYKVDGLGWRTTEWGSPFPLVFLNGLLMTEGDDYIRDGLFITFNPGRVFHGKDKVVVVDESKREVFVVSPSV